MVDDEGREMEKYGVMMRDVGHDGRGRFLP
jgi:hypothetical protein